MLNSDGPQVESFYTDAPFGQVDDFYYGDYVSSFLTLDTEW